MSYRCEATSVAGFIQQVAVGYLARGYYFYVSGKIPERKDPRKVDAKLIRRYGIDLSRGQRYRRKKAGLANVQYIRHERFFLLLATHGKHRFFEDEAEQIRDARRVPMKYAGYSISHRNGHASVRIDPREYRRMRDCFAGIAIQRFHHSIVKEFQNLPFEPYAPLRRQVLGIWREVNRRRKAANLAPIPLDQEQMLRRIVSPFATHQAVAKRCRSCSQP